jgi:hypothetical protein
MKNKIYFILLIFSILIVSCEKDNFTPPSSTLSGRLTYKGDSIGVEYTQVPWNLFQSGFNKKGFIADTFTPEGTYSILVFDGDYKFTIPKNQGPFLWKELTSNSRDSVNVSLRGNQILDIEVIPYYMIRKPSFSLMNGKISATFDIEKVITDVNAKSIQSVSLFVNNTQFVSNQSNQKLAQVDLSGASITTLSNISFSLTVPNLPVAAEKYVFARLGNKITGVEDMIYSSVRKIQL